jgi:hypothetical protein
MRNNPDIDPFNRKKKLNVCNYNLHKCNCSIFLDVMLKYSKDYLENDVIEWREKEREREGEMTLANVSFRKSFRTNAVHSFEAYSSYPPTLVLL